MTKLANRVISIFDRKTSMRLAVPEWSAVDDICKRECIKRKKLFEFIHEHRDQKLGFTCSVRLFTIMYMHNRMPDYTPKASNRNKDYKNILNTLKMMA